MLELGEDGLKTVTPTMARAFGQYDLGNRALACRIAGGECYLEEWLALRARDYKPVRVVPLRNDRPTDRLGNNGPRQWRPVDIMSGTIMYRVGSNRKRGVEHMETLGRAFRAAAVAVEAIFAVSEADIIHCDRIDDAAAVPRLARLAWQSIASALVIGVVRDSELARALGVEASHVATLREHHCIALGDCSYAERVKRAEARAFNIFEGLRRAPQG